jgi:hypothetical protein
MVYLEIAPLTIETYLSYDIKDVFLAIVLFPIQNILDEGHYLSRKQVGSALTETENWDLLVDCKRVEMAGKC